MGAPSDPEALAWLTKIEEIARATFARSGHHIPMLLIDRPDGRVVIGLADFNNSMLPFVREKCEEFARADARAIAIVIERWITAGVGALARARGVPIEEITTRKEALGIELAARSGYEVSRMLQIHRDGPKVWLDDRPPYEVPKLMTDLLQDLPWNR
jgi:hypothetical protein